MKTTLEDRYKEGRNYYITIPANHCSQFDEHVFEQLRGDLGFLGAFRIGTQQGDQIFVLAEGSLNAKIREFLLMLQNYQ
ncbi:MAG: hypothetical protein KDK05_08130 [Candidatus Competibacteraceae bacterium]|nr:hypothetical protein [Candidatus Competibacteraceae bacterium]